MYEIEKSNSSFPSTTNLSKIGVKAVGYTAAGIFVLILNAFPVWLGLIAGGLVCLLGIGSMRSKDLTDKKAGIIITTAGVLTVLSKVGIPLIAPVSQVLLGIGVFGLLALGIWNGIKFIIGLKKRS
jgi:hypothetical protein